MARISIRKRKGLALNTTILIFAMKHEAKWIRLPMQCLKGIEMCGISSTKMGLIVINCALYALLMI